MLQVDSLRHWRLWVYFFSYVLYVYIFIWEIYHHVLVCWLCAFILLCGSAFVFWAMVDVDVGLFENCLDFTMVTKQFLLGSKNTKFSV